MRMFLGLFIGVSHRYLKHQQVAKRLLGKVLKPANVEEARSVNSTLFSVNVQGRVSDSRTFNSAELNTEYIFSLCTPSSTFSFSTTRVNFSFVSFYNTSVPVLIDTWMTWDEEKWINQYDVTFRWWGFLLDELLESIHKDKEVAERLVLQKLVASIYDTHTTHCTRSNIQYPSQDACTSFLLGEVRLSQLGLHYIMLKFQPDVHCSHIGKTRGGMCEDDQTYVGKVTESYFKNSPWILGSVGRIDGQRSSMKT
ncbi:uncharacterized protein CC84DRAFT_1186956 [Paraphaeosphaeria sporulosa]|uniref:Uncharacterized protein n=1 Tax=Paraphaeosphaeria sporulosa TaxID=1460663 RepID=A0A177CF25_9PLEO|nr:uncharacterized protein CC84DRAFT_1186956 [Paraphaeosphaeria sporulosa]OAG05801.1 hypothetical protein CC84DRAFT_1186956 [Paraphaeosphaeria sporulosa]